MRGIRPPKFLPGRGSAKGLGEIVSRVLATGALSRRMADGEISKAWRQIVGPEVSQHTEVVGFRGSVVTVEVESAAWLQELGGFHKASLLKELQQKVGAPFIRELRFRQRGSRG